MSSFVLGIDPGLNGALALFNGEHVEIIDMPCVERSVNGKSKRQVDLYQLGNWLDLNRNRIRRAVIEQVTSSPQMGVASAFRNNLLTKSGARVGIDANGMVVGSEARLIVQ